MRKTGQVPPLVNAIRNAGRQVATGDRDNARRYAAIHSSRAGSDMWTKKAIPSLMEKISHYASSSERSDAWTKAAQALPGASGVNVTAPSFYTPFTTPSAFQIPNTRKEVYLWAEWFKDHEPKVAAAIEFYTDFPFSKFELQCANSVVKKYFENMVKRLNLVRWLPLISFHYHLFGDCFTMASIDCDKCHGMNRLENGDMCKHEGATWKSISILDANNVEVAPAMHDQIPDYYLTITDEMIKIVQEGPANKYFNSIPDKLKKQILSREPILLDPATIYHFKRGASANQPYGVSMVMRLFQTLAYKDKLRQAQWLVAERHILPVKIVNIGTDDRPASDEDIEAAQEELTNVANDPLLTIVTHHAFKLDFVGASGHILQLSNEWELIDTELLDGMMINKLLLNGEGPNYGSAQVGLISIERRLEKLRSEVSHWLEEKIFKPVAEWNGFVVEGKGGEEDLIYPTIKWSGLQLRDDSNKLNTMSQLMQQGTLSAQTMLEALDIDYDQEVERLRYEQSATFLTNPAAGGMGAAPVGGMGSGFGGGMDMSGLGGMPEMGTPEMGGGAPPPGMPPAAASIDTRDNKNLFKFAASTMNTIHDDYSKTNSTNKQFRSAMHKAFADSLHKPTGRGYCDKINEDFEFNMLDHIEGPIGGGNSVVPLNIYAQREFQPLFKTAINKKEEQQMRILFSKLEQKLYNIILNMRIPYAFYAQYTAGPNMEYQLDGAFPAIHLAVEADSETFHNNAEQISKDQRRDSLLASQGWTVLRFTENEIEDFPNEIQQVILSTIRKLTTPTANHKL